MVVAREIMHDTIVFMHPVARLDQFRSKTDDLTELANRFAFGDWRGRKLVAFRNSGFRDGAVRRMRADLDLVDRDQNIVVGMQAQGARGVHVSCPFDARSGEELGPLFGEILEHCGRLPQMGGHCRAGRVRIAPLYRRD